MPKRAILIAIALVAFCGNADAGKALSFRGVRKSTVTTNGAKERITVPSRYSVRVRKNTLSVKIQDREARVNAKGRIVSSKPMANGGRRYEVDFAGPSQRRAVNKDAATELRPTFRRFKGALMGELAKGGFVPRLVLRPLLAILPAPRLNIAKKMESRAVYEVSATHLNVTSKNSLSLLGSSVQEHTTFAGSKE